MEATLPWFQTLNAQERSWVGLVAQAGIGAFVAWYSKATPQSPEQLSIQVFAAAPRELASTITLQQTVELVRTTIGVVEEHVDELATDEHRDELRTELLLYSREIAFAAADVYAKAAESRGAWDARLEALIIEALINDAFDQSAMSQAAALGWHAHNEVLAMAGAAPDDRPEFAMDVLRHAATNHDFDIITGVHGTTLVALIGGRLDPTRVGRFLSPHFGDGPVVIGSLEPTLEKASASVRQALSGLIAAPAWPEAPRPVFAADLLPERALAGDHEAATELAHATYGVLKHTDEALLETAETYLEKTPSLEACARTLFVHANTIRYRLRKITELTGRNPADPRDAFVLRTGLALGRLR